MENDQAREIATLLRHERMEAERIVRRSYQDDQDTAPNDGPVEYLSDVLFIIERQLSALYTQRPGFEALFSHRGDDRTPELVRCEMVVTWDLSYEYTLRASRTYRYPRQPIQLQAEVRTLRADEGSRSYTMARWDRLDAAIVAGVPYDLYIQAEASVRELLREEVFAAVLVNLLNERAKSPFV